MFWNYFLFRARKYLTEEELFRVLHDDPSDNEEYGTGEDEEYSENEEEIITQSDHESDSEQEYVPGNSDSEFSDDDAVDTDGQRFFVGKDQISKWNKIPVATTSKTKRKNIVRIFPGPKSHAKGLTSEISAFEKLINANMVERVVNYTNMYIESKRVDIEYSRERDSKHTTKSEIMALLGLLIIIGTKKANHVNVQELWANDGSGLEITRQVMSYKRFLFLIRCLRFDDRNTREEKKKIDKLAAVRDIYIQVL